jgi:hypothetical protein
VAESKMAIQQEEKDKIIEMWQEGKTGKEIAEIIFSTRNAVIGFINRERKKGLDLRKTTRACGSMRRKPSKKIVSIFEKSLPARDRRLIQIHELTPTSCRFIVEGEGVGAIFCGHPISMKSYCEKHAKICYVKAR